MQTAGNVQFVMAPAQVYRLMQGHMPHAEVELGNVRAKALDAVQACGVQADIRLTLTKAEGFAVMAYADYDDKVRGDRGLPQVWDSMTEQFVDLCIAGNQDA
jgi:hypothetical protein